MAKKLVGTNLNAPIVPNYEVDTYATHADIYGVGGYRAVNTIEERDAITFERRSIGMEVRVLSGEGAGLYCLKSFDGNVFDGVTSQVWEEVLGKLRWIDVVGPEDEEPNKEEESTKN